MIRTSSSTDLAWFKSSYSSGGETDSCVEIANEPDTVHVRDSKNRPGAGPRLVVTPEAWADFVTAVRS
ncbi:DUF397 domain-containing protein [Streptomyces pactum]|uniref:DUF397 domain-containing protein n=1 Tax=Streptomyces pactum TaxID=68249 RepID=A0A1S6J7G4_9ACTN|nr:DUF397 domain-containing protein [Streptomyces pactum]AQS67708.1 DUF397 domain-containing protein [Streptomyces pactum]